MQVTLQTSVQNCEVRAQAELIVVVVLLWVITEQAYLWLVLVLDII